MRNILYFLSFACLLFSCKKEDIVTPTPPTNKAPVAKAGKDDTIYIPQISYMLDGKASFDPDKNYINYYWRQIVGPDLDFFMQNSHQTTASIGVREEGRYEFELTVTDPSGLSGRDTVMVTVIDNFAVGRVPVVKLICNTHMVPYPSDQIELLGNAYIENEQGLKFYIKSGFSARQIAGPSVTMVQDAYLDYDHIAIPIQNLTKGTYQFQVGVTRKGITGYDTAIIQVVDDTVRGKEYIFESKWVLENNKVLAKLPAKPEIFYASRFHKTELFVFTEADARWYEVEEGWDSNAWLYYTRNTCSSSIEVVMNDDLAQYAVGQKVTIRIKYL